MFLGNHREPPAFCRFAFGVGAPSATRVCIREHEVSQRCNFSVRLQPDSTPRQIDGVIEPPLVERQFREE